MSAPIAATDRRNVGWVVPPDLLRRFGRSMGARGWAVYSALAQFANEHGQCRPSQATIAGMFGISPRQIVREVANLEALGLIEVQRHPAGTPDKANVYVLLPLPCQDVSSASVAVVPAWHGSTDATVAVVPASHAKKKESSFLVPSPVSESGTGVGVPETIAAPLAPHVPARAARPRQAPAKPPAQPHAIQALVDALQAELGESQASYKRHVRDAKVLAEDGATAEDVVGCIRWILAHPRRAAFYADQPLTMTTVRKLMRGYRSDPAPLEHVRRCYRAILRGVRIDEADATPEVLGDYWDLARTAVATDATPDQIDAAAARAMTADRRNADLPPTARMVGAQLTAIRAAARRARAKEAAHA